MIELNTLGAMYTAHAALPHLLAAAEQEPRQVADLVITSSVAGGRVRLGSGVYNASKHAVGAFAEALRMEVTQRHVRVSLIEPGAVETELASHNRPEVQERMEQRFAGVERLQADDIARTIAFVVTSPRHMAVNEVLIRPTWQSAPAGERLLTRALRRAIILRSGPTVQETAQAAATQTAPPSTSVGQCTRAEPGRRRG